MWWNEKIEIEIEMIEKIEMKSVKTMSILNFAYLLYKLIWVWKLQQCVSLGQKQI